MFEWDPELRAESGNAARVPYSILIENESDDVVILQRRFWEIFDLNAMEPFTVEGKGVVGKTPRIEVGESFSYSSSTLAKGHTNMRGHYTFLREKDASEFLVQIPTFSVWNEKREGKT